MRRKNAWTTYNKKQLDELEKLCKNYLKFLDKGKTERECVKQIVKQAEEKGYVNLADITKDKKALKAGDKVYSVCMDKTVALFQIGKKKLEKGMNILGAHIDSPRMDVKQNPLYESEEFVYLDTHYYGGIKKYQWVTLPLALHGVVVKKDGTVITVNVGEDKNDPVFCVTDLLIHLAGEQMEKKANKVIEGENLDVLVGSKPLEGKEKDAVKEGILEILKEKYDMTEEDFMSAEIEVVPAGHAREAGLDHSMVMSYGQDDRVCAYAGSGGSRKNNLLSAYRQRGDRKCRCDRYAVPFLREFRGRADGCNGRIQRVIVAQMSGKLQHAFIRCKCSV